MRRALLTAALVLLVGQLMGGFTYPTNIGGASVGGGSGSTSPQWYCAFINDGSIVDTDVWSAMEGAGQPQTTGVASDDLVLMFAPNKTAGQWVISGMSVLTNTTLAATTDDCLINLTFAPFGGADTTTVASIATGPNTTLGNDGGVGACEASILGADATTVDDAGDFCLQTFAPVTGAVGEGWKFRFSDEDAGGANTCGTGYTSATTCVLAQLINDAGGYGN